MKITFKSEKEKRKFVKWMGTTKICPSAMGFRDAVGSDCGIGLCCECWEEALKGQKVKEKRLKRR